MKVTILNGINNDIIFKTLEQELNKMDYSFHSFSMPETEVAGCRGCFGCWVKTPGICVIDDAGREIAKAVIQSNLTVVLSPVTFGGYSYHIKKAFDRLIPLISPHFMKIRGEIHHQRRYSTYPKLLVIGVLPQEDQESEEIFQTLVERNAINFHTPAWIACVLTSNLPAGKLGSKISDLLLEVSI